MSTSIAASPLPTTPPVRVTPEEYLLLPDEGRGYELVDGQLVELDVSAESSRTGYELGWHIGAHCRTRQPAWIFGSDASFRCFPDAVDKVRRADVSVIVFDRMSPEQYAASGHISICPDLVVEVTSPNDMVGDVTLKRIEWLAAGAKLVWVVNPADRSVSAYQPDTRPVVYTADDTLPGEPVLPGFTVPVADLFRLPGLA